MAPRARQHHRSYLLRLWRAGNGNAPEWRFSLEDARTHERHGFADLISVMAFLEAIVGDDVRPWPATKPNEIGSE